MSLGRRLLGIFGILLAVFAGGCGLVFLISGLIELAAGRSDYGISIIGLVVGGVPALIGGVIAWWSFRKPRNAVAPATDEDKPA